MTDWGVPILAALSVATVKLWLMIVTSMGITTAGGVLASSPASAWSVNEVSLFTALFNFNTVGILGRVKFMRGRVAALSSP